MDVGLATKSVHSHNEQVNWPKARCRLGGGSPVNLMIGLLAFCVVGFQWLTQSVTVKIWGPWKISFDREEWPAFFWITMAVEFVIGVLFIYSYFA